MSAGSAPPDVDHDLDHDVVIVGGGPVGLTAAHALGRFGIRTALLEPRSAVDEGSPRCKQLNPRSMEIYRSLGIADVVRDGSRLPRGWSSTATFSTSLTGHRIEQFDDVFSLQDARRDDLAEPALWCPQNQVEASLRGALGVRETVEPLYGWRLEEFVQDDGGVVVTARDPDGVRRTIRCRYLIGADGARSAVRKQSGIGLQGSTDVVTNLQVTFRSPELAQAHGLGAAVQHWIVHPRVSGLMGQLDLDGTWWAIILNAPLDAPRPWLEEALATMIGTDVPVTILSEDPWTARMLVAESYREGRVFLAGDAAHLNPPWGGFGANTGIGDAMDLAWKLAAVLRGWGGTELLDSYEAERRPMAARTIEEATRNMTALGPRLVHPRMDDAGPEGDAARTEVAATIRELKTAELYTTGFVLGARYRGSPIIRYDDGPAPESSTTVYHPSTAPGSRLPNHWLGRDDSLLDLLGDGLTVLDLGPTAAGDAWEPAADQAGIPLTHVRPNRPDLREVLGAAYLLVRPDGIVAWRGERLPESCADVLQHARGSAPVLTVSI